MAFPYVRHSAAWKDADSATGGGDTSTPVNATALNNIEAGIDSLSDILENATADEILSAISSTSFDWKKITNANVDAAAAIAYSKLNLASSIVNADVAASAGIVQTKLAAPPQAKARRASAQAITTATWTLVTWDSEDYDTDTIHDNSTNPARLTAKTAGKYQFNAFAEIDSSTAGIRAWVVQKNSEALPSTAAWVGGFVYSSPSTAIALPISVAGVVDMAVNDYLVVVTYQDSGANRNVQTESYFEMHRIGT